MAKLLLTCLILGITLLFPLAGVAQQYSRVEQLPPIKLSYTQLVEVLDRMRTLIQVADPNAFAGAYSDKIRLSDGVVEVSISGVVTPQVLANVPELSYNADYQFLAEEGPVSAVSFRLADWSREVRVEGSSAEQVDAVVRQLVTDFTRNISPLTGWSARLVGFVALMIGGTVAIALVPWARSSFHRALLVAAYPAAFVIAFALPWERILPGTLIFEADPAFYIRYAAEISFVGFLVGLVALIFPLLRSQTAPPVGAILAPVATPKVRGRKKP